jgi:hypothetical protein
MTLPGEGEPVFFLSSLWRIERPKKSPRTWQHSWTKMRLRFRLGSLRAGGDPLTAWEDVVRDDCVGGHWAFLSQQAEGFHLSGRGNPSCQWVSLRTQDDLISLIT